MSPTLPVKSAPGESASPSGPSAMQHEAGAGKFGLDGTDRIAGAPEGWLMTAVHKFLGWLGKLRQLTVQGMTASNSTHTPQHQTPEEEK